MGSHDPDHARFPFAKFKERSFIHSRNTEGGLTFLKGSRDHDHAPFRGNFSLLG